MFLFMDFVEKLYWALTKIADLAVKAIELEWTHIFCAIFW